MLSICGEDEEHGHTRHTYLIKMPAYVTGLRGVNNMCVDAELRGHGEPEGFLHMHWLLQRRADLPQAHGIHVRVRACN